MPPVSTIFLPGSKAVTFTGKACALNLVKNLTVSPNANLPSMWSMFTSQEGYVLVSVRMFQTVSAEAWMVVVALYVFMECALFLVLQGLFDVIGQRLFIELRRGNAHGSRLAAIAFEQSVFVI